MINNKNVSAQSPYLASLKNKTAMQKTASKQVSNNYSLKIQQQIKSINSKRHKAFEREITKEDKIKAFLGSSLMTLVVMGLIAKKQKIKNPFLIKYSPKEMITLSASSIIGGVGFGMINENNKTRINRIKEGVFQFFNASVPVLFTSSALKLLEHAQNNTFNKNSLVNNPLLKGVLILSSVIAGVFSASKLSNKICDPYNKEPDRKITLKDSIANIDDLFATLAMLKIPMLNKLNVERLLPFVYALCGYRAGESN